MDSMPPEALLADYPPAIASLGQALRDLVRRVLPQAVERVRPGWRVIGYDVPVGRRTRFVAWVMPEREHIHLGFPHGVRLPNPEARLDGAGITKRARWLTYRPGEQVDEPVAAAYLRRAAAAAGLPPDVRPEA
jgi:hypothetical protein